MPFLKNTLLILLICLLSFGAFQKRYGIIRSKPLNGYFSTTPKPAFSLAAWMSGEFQEQYRISLEDNVGFKPDFVRLYNQLDFSLFNIANANKLIVGKEGYLFAKTYIDGYTGKDLARRGVMDHQVREAKFLQDYLMKEHGILLVVVFAPGKGFYYPEYIPDRYLKTRKDETNYSYFIQRCREAGINHIDFNGYLLGMKDTSSHLLYPKAGIHWSNYAAWLCADSLHTYIEHGLARSIPRMHLDSLEFTSEARGEDNDMERTMNLIWPISQPAFTYPAFHFRYDSVMPKPAGLVVGDSFYWYWYYSGIIEHTFSNKEFWYYNNEIYPEQFTTPKNVGQIDFKEAVLRQNVIILLQTNGAYGNLGYGWVDLAYDYFYPGMTRSKEIQLQMKDNPEWYKSLESKAKDRNIATGHMMRLDAIHMMNLELK